MQTQKTPLSSNGQPHGQAAKGIPEWPGNQLEAEMIELKNILRWEDDGGRLATVGELEAASNTCKDED